MNTKPANQVHITSGFWSEIQAINTRQAILHQWEQLENSGCIENFRICAGRSTSPRTGLFFSDSDAYKWLDAACRILRRDPRLDLQERVDHLTDLILAAQAEDGYIYTYNQILFPDCRWKNLQIEHELYCMGHLIEAGISHHNLGLGDGFFNGIQKTADLICHDFELADWRKVDGHEEIEIALLKLAAETGQAKYSEMARIFLERRRAGHGYGFLFFKEAVNTVRRLSRAEKMRKETPAKRLGSEDFKLPARNQHKTTWSVWPRLVHSLLSGKYSQRDEELNDSSAPAGHSVRFAYLETAAAMLARQSGDMTLISGMEKKWERMVSRRMYVTGGIGSLPLIEGFGRDFELDPQLAYTETCAALGSVFWNREMSLLTGDPRYDDLLEWQLYNAVSVGFGRDGCSYFYNNPLISHGHVHRAAWYDVPCCPSNMSRTWAELEEYIYSTQKNQITIHQYISSEMEFGEGNLIRMESGFPWNGKVKIRLEVKKETDLLLNLRYPSWADGFELFLNGKPMMVEIAEIKRAGTLSACGIEFGRRDHIVIDRSFVDGDELELTFGTPLKILRQDQRIRSCRGMAALARGPIVYCLEDCDNPGISLPPKIVKESLTLMEGEEFFTGIPLVKGVSFGGQPVRFIPYYLWGNRGRTSMSAFFYPQE